MSVGLDGLQGELSLEPALCRVAGQVSAALWGNISALVDATAQELFLQIRDYGPDGQEREAHRVEALDPRSQVGRNALTWLMPGQGELVVEQSTSCEQFYPNRSIIPTYFVRQRVTLGSDCDTPPRWIENRYIVAAGRIIAVDSERYVN